MKGYFRFYVHGEHSTQTAVVMLLNREYDVELFGLRSHIAIF